MSEHIDITAHWDFIGVKEAKGLLKIGSYKTEEAFCDKIEYNIEKVCSKVFNSPYVSHVREFEIHSPYKKNSRADFYVRTENHNIILECKNPRSGRQPGIQQLMRYIILCEQYKLPVDRYVLFTTAFTLEDSTLIKRFKLPIEVFFVCDEKVITII